MVAMAALRTATSWASVAPAAWRSMPPSSWASAAARLRRFLTERVGAET